jgi:hypothetical protein
VAAWLGAHPPELGHVTDAAAVALSYSARTEPREGGR